MTEISRIRRLAALLTAVATLVPVMLISLVDAGAESGRPVVEAQHEPGRCHVAHDHRACVHHASSAPHPATGQPSTPVPPPVLRDRPSTRGAAPAADDSYLPLSRAPPSLS